MKVDLDFRELVYARYAISRRLDRTTHDYERNKRMFPNQIDNAAKFASMEAEMTKIITVILYQASIFRNGFNKARIKFLLNIRK